MHKASTPQDVSISPVRSLRRDRRFSKLKQGNDLLSGRLAAANIKRQLRQEYPGVDFRVHRPCPGTIFITWTDGPTNGEVRRHTQRYEAGKFDRANGIYLKDKSNNWCKVFGGAEYVNASRAVSDALIERAIGIVYERLGLLLEGESRPSADDYRSGQLDERVVATPTGNAPLLEIIRRTMTRLKG